MDHVAALQELRNVLLSVVITTTGETSLGSVGNGFTRATGSFVTDGFLPGMEVQPSGFPVNTPVVVRSVAPLLLTTYQTLQAVAIVPNRSLTIGIPANRAWENKKFTANAFEWFIEEDYLPGPRNRIGTTMRGPYEHLPSYILRIVGISGMGEVPLLTLAQAVLDRFTPGMVLPMPDNLPLRVGSSPAPYAGAILSIEANRSELLVTIPLNKRSFLPG